MIVHFPTHGSDSFLCIIKIPEPFLVPIENTDTIDDVFAAFEEVGEKMRDEKYLEMYANFIGTYEYVRVSIIHSRPDPSYTPECLKSNTIGPI